MADRWAGEDTSVMGPISSAVAITPADATDLTNVTRGLSVNADGNIVVKFRADSATVTIAVVAGVVYPFRVKQVYSTLTTATGITGYF